MVDDDSKFHENRLLEISHNFRDWVTPKLDGINLLKGVNGLAAVEKFIVAAIRSKGTDEMALFDSSGTGLLLLLTNDSTDMSPKMSGIGLELSFLRTMVD